MADNPAITLYRLQGCPFCERVVRVLQDNGITYRSRFVEARHSRRDAVKRLTGARTVPAIVDESTGATMAESANIVEYLATTYGQPETESESIRADGAGCQGDRCDGDALGQEHESSGGAG